MKAPQGRALLGVLILALALSILSLLVGRGHIMKLGTARMRSTPTVATALARTPTSSLHPHTTATATPVTTPTQTFASAPSVNPTPNPEATTIQTPVHFQTLTPTTTTNPVAVPTLTVSPTPSASQTVVPTITPTTVSSPTAAPTATSTAFTSPTASPTMAPTAFSYPTSYPTTTPTAVAIPTLTPVPPTPSSGIRFVGVDYVAPSDTYTGCPDWTWLRPDCYANISLTGYHISPQLLFQSDMSYIQVHNLGTVQHIWISLDQLFSEFDPTAGYRGYSSQALANVDDVLHWLHNHDMKADLVLFIWTADAHLIDQFHPEALDGYHAAMRANYLRALHDFVAHLAADPIDAHTVAVMDLMAEAYYQLETYFQSSPARLGQWAYAMPPDPAGRQCYVPGNTVCTGGSAGHGCLNQRLTSDDATCVDVNIVYPWLRDLYATARAAGPGFNYTVSDTGRLLTTSTAPYGSQRWWVSLYPVDLYDLHLYVDAPWTEASRWATGRNLPKPWIADDVGCASGNVNCTYVPANAEPVDRWWIQHLAADGARALMVDGAAATAWTTDAAGAPTDRQLSVVGQDIAAYNAATPTVPLGADWTQRAHHPAAGR
jgi:hypothetical protein